MREGPGLPYLQECSKRKERVWRGLVSPEGIVYGPIRNLAAFCRQFGLQENNVRLVLHGLQGASKGWVLADEFDLMSAIPWEPVRFEYYLESPTGAPFGPIRDTRGVGVAVKKTGLPYSVVRGLLSGRLVEYQGWTLVTLEGE